MCLSMIQTCKTCEIVIIANQISVTSKLYTHVLYELDRVELQLYSDKHFLKLLQKVKYIQNVESLWGKK